MERSLKASALLLLLSATIVLASFAPPERIDHENKPTNGCGNAAITLGPGPWSNQPIYVAFEDDSSQGIIPIRTDVMFQKSDDGGRMWLTADVLVKRGSPFAEPRDIATDSDGDIYIVYLEKITPLNRLVCVRSRDGGSTWSELSTVVECTRPAFIGLARIAVDTGGNLFCAWNGGPLDNMHIFSSMSTDKGATWSPSVRVCRDSLYPAGCAHPDVFVQPGTNHYLVVANSPYYDDPVIRSHAYLYRSTDRGHTFQSGVQLDTFRGSASQPHVVADARHVICDYTGRSRDSVILNTEARTLWIEPDTWSNPSLVSRLDSTQFGSYTNGAKLAISADGSVHTALMIDCDTVEGIFLTYYARSSDHGVTWSDLEFVGDDPTIDSWNPDIAADAAGHAYVVWQVGSGEVWFSTNRPLAIAEEPMQQAIIAQPSATVVRNVLVLGAVDSRQETEYRAELLSIAGRKVLDLKAGANDVSVLAPGVYFIREGLGTRGERSGKTRKVVVAR